MSEENKKDDNNGGYEKICYIVYGVRKCISKTILENNFK